ncbi:Peptidase S24-like protein [Planctomycetes bacterium Poly30]|uniref:Signal peptidase I n=2 Tax=Saltatorellus ferox TaxID=2528018 RepID=A0A518ELJ8_9BACT|nr:Peptidase S24-like protein [Planctomycetes bacterium Poly30]
MLGVAIGTSAILGVAAIVSRSAVGWVYPIGSGSMERTLMTGESVFLRYGTDVENRFDIVAFRDLGGGASIKRTWGLPGESFAINLSGDVRINGEFLPDAPGRPAPTVIFDSRLQAIDEHWRHGGTAFDPWTREPPPAAGESEIWTLDGTVVDRGSDLGLLRFQDRVTDGYLTEEGEYVHGPNVVQDVIVEFEVQVLSTGGYLRIQLSEQNDLFEVNVLMYEAEEDYRALVRRIVPQRFDRAGRTSFGIPRAPVPIGEWVPMRLANIDNRISLTIGEMTFQYDYDANTPRRDPSTGRDAPFSAGPRAKLGACGLPARFRNLRVLRDVHVVPRGRFGVGTAITLKTNEIFLLGDNSQNSRDSRERGPIKVEQVLGTARAVVLPLGHFRRL